MINDFLEYWAAANLLLQGGNPYSSMEMLVAERALGWSNTEALMMWNPPWTLTLLLPFGLLPYETAQFVWFVFHVLILFLGSQALWGWYGGSPAKPWYPLLAVLSFAPVYFALLLGQIGPLILLGIIGFLAGVQKKAWKLSGASLVLVAIKPHLLYLLWLALLLWVVKERKWRLAIAFGASFIAAAVVPLLFRPALYAQYLRLIQHGVGVTRPLEGATRLWLSCFPSRMPGCAGFLASSARFGCSGIGPGMANGIGRPRRRCFLPHPSQRLVLRGPSIMSCCCLP